MSLHNILFSQDVILSFTFVCSIRIVINRILNYHLHRVYHRKLWNYWIPRKMIMSFSLDEWLACWLITSVFTFGVWGSFLIYSFLFWELGLWCFNISVISWLSVLLVEDTGVTGENHWPVASHWQTLSHKPHHKRDSNSQS